MFCYDLTAYYMYVCINRTLELNQLRLSPIPNPITTWFKTYNVKVQRQYIHVYDQLSSFTDKDQPKHDKPTINTIQQVVKKKIKG